MKKIFISYSHEDTTFKDLLVKQLKVLELEGLCDLWEDSRIQTGTDFLPAIKTAIEQADIAVLMVSAGFLTSPFIRGNETPPILKRRKKEGLIVLPLFVKPCSWEKISWLNGIQGEPLDNKTLIEMNEAERLRFLTEFSKRISNILHPKPESIMDREICPGTANKTPHSGAILFTSLPHRKIKLIGRENDLVALEKVINRSKRVVLVNGLGGIGKTEVCKSFFYSHYDQYQYAAWIEWASTLKESLVYVLGSNDSEFIQSPDKDTIDARFKKIINRLRKMHESFLLVVDNIESPNDNDLDVLASLPDVVKVLVNSRYIIEGYEVQNLDYLSPVECKTLFYEFYKGKPEAGDDEAVENITALCGYHTLTIELLAKTAYHGGMGIQTLNKILKEKGFNLNEVAGEKVTTVWHNEKEKKRFFDHLIKVFDIIGITEEELSVLVNMSVLPAVYIPLAWIHDWLKLKDNNAITSLVEKGWLKRDEETRLYLHPVMQEVVKYRAKPDAKKCKELINSLVNKLSVEPGENPILKKEYILYGESVVRYLAIEAKEEDAALATLANNVSARHFDIGQLDRALNFQLKALSIREAVLDKNHPDLAGSYNNVSSIYLAKGQLDLALEFQLKALSIRESVLDKNHPDLAESYNDISLIYKSMGQLDQALEFQLKDIAISKKVLVENHPDLATSYNNVSLIYQALGQLDRALKFQLKALAIRESFLDKNHPDLATSYNNITSIYKDMNQLDRALEFQLKANGIFEATLDENHSLRATSYNNLSTIYRDIGQLDRALEFQLKDITITEKISGENHPDLATSYNNVSSIYLEMEQLEPALEFQLKAISIMQHLFPNGHPNLDVFKKNLEDLEKRLSIMNVKC